MSNAVVRGVPWVVAMVAVLSAMGGSTAAAEPDVFESLDINEGELVFLVKPPKRPPHLQSNHMVISEESLKTGWVTSKQCHYHLDRFAAMQVVFRPGAVRNLRILEAENIGHAWVEGASVQLTDIGADAVLCLYSENRALKRNELDGSFEWSGGPYMRRFLDGYFPMHVKLAIDYPARLLRLQTLEPQALKLRAVEHPGHVRIDALFEGRLTVTLGFAARIETTHDIGW